MREPSFLVYVYNFRLSYHLSFFLSFFLSLIKALSPLAFNYKPTSFISGGKKHEKNRRNFFFERNHGVLKTLNW